MISHPLSIGPSFGTQQMNQTLNEQRRTGRPIEYTPETMFELTNIQNEFIYNELWHVFRVNLAPKIQHMLDECSHDAHLAVKAKLEIEGRREQLFSASTGEMGTIEGLLTSGRNIGRQAAAAAPPMPPRDWAVSAQKPTPSSSVGAGGEWRAGKGTATAPHERGLCARRKGGGAVNGSAHTMGGGDCGSEMGPRGHLAGKPASDHGQAQGEERHDPEGSQVKRGATSIQYP